MKELLLFHHTNHLVPYLTHNNLSKGRPSFYWYSDRFHDHISDDKPVYKYMYFFFVNPKRDIVQLRSRTGDMDFNDLHNYYVDYKTALQDPEIKYAEPGIVMSFSKMVPDIILEHKEKGIFKKWVESEVIWPLSEKGNKVRFHYNTGKPVPFTEIPVLSHTYPALKKCLPIWQPVRNNGKWEYPDWVPMKTHKNGTWL